ncbi:MAG TPA: hypothetical protein VIS56_00930 [Candidatus Saccharimonadales bacterium]
MRSRTNKLRSLIVTYWQPAVFYGMLIIFFGLLSWFRLGILTGGYSAAELAALQASDSLGHVLSDPVNAPFNLVAYLLSLLHIGGDQSLLALRATSTAFGLLTLTVFYWLVRHWHGERSAILGTVVFGCSAWFLHTARLGTPDILFFLLLSFVACSVWLKQTDNRLLLLIGFALVASLLYIPGMVWLLLIGGVWYGKNIVKLFKEHFVLMGLGSVGLLALVAPLAWAVFRSAETARAIAGLPAKGWPHITDVLQRLANVPYNLFAQGPLDPQHWLGRLPILEAFSIAMVVLGAYLYWCHRRLARTKMVATALLAGALLISLGGAVSVSILIPFVYILVAAGIGFMLDRWQTVFPRNVIAQSVGVGLISIAVIAASWYGIRHYFVAWPNAPETRQVFTIK